MEERKLLNSMTEITKHRKSAHITSNVQRSINLFVLFMMLDVEKQQNIQETNKNTSNNINYLLTERLQQKDYIIKI